MSGALFLDTETTGLVDPEPIELAYLGPLPFDSLYHPSDVQCRRFKPTKSISLGALATHHIFDSDLLDEPRWRGSWPLPEGTEYLVGHNIDFDWRAIGSPAIKRICTLAISRHLWPELDSHSLAALAYKLFPSREEARSMLRSHHSASMDVLLLVRVTSRMLVAVPEIVTWAQLWEYSELARVPTRFTFGKYGPADGNPGRLIRDIRREDPGYIEWCLYKCDQCKDEYWQRALRGQA